MITQKNIEEVLKKYDPKNIHIGVLGGHSALDVCTGVKKYGFKTVAVCQKGRSETYSKYYKTRERDGKTIGCVDEIIEVDKFKDIVKPEVQEKLRSLNTIFIHNRYFWVYCDFNEIENDFLVPIYGSRGLVKLEERHMPKNQYYLLEKAGIRTPKNIRKSGSGWDENKMREVLDEHFVKDGGGPLIVKVNEAIRGYERAFFVIAKTEDYFKISERMVSAGQITKQDLDNSVIEEFIIGAQVNMNFFYSVVTGELELMGTDTRRQTNLDGFLRLDTNTQKELLDAHYRPSMIETGHISCTVKESLVEKIFDMGEKFVATMKKEVAPGIIGPFALQGAVATRAGKEEIVIFDVSMRIPGSPGTKYTPYSGYLYGESMSYGERIGMEIENAEKIGKLGEIVT
jgi:5-formaminoimidazole-4-carboxamide-1-(beta)-D-ribofuranosyl 5'-monophosphate synthetase